MTSKHVLVLSLLITFCSLANCVRVLGIFPMAAPSHNILGSNLMKGLAERGHEVTYISPYNEPKPPKNFRQIVLTGFKEKMDEMRKHMPPFQLNKKNPFIMTAMMSTMMVQSVDDFLDHPNVKSLVQNKDEKFDVVIIEQFMNEGIKAISTHFGAPLIMFSTMGANMWVNDLVGNPSPLSYIPHLLTGFNEHMTLCQRIYNIALITWNKLLFDVYVLPKNNQIVQKHFPNLNANMYEIQYNSSLVLLNSHSSFAQPVPYVPNMVDIGGYHVRPAKKLPDEWQKYMDGAKEGVILFSFGSHMNSSLLPPEKKQLLLNVFSKLKMNVLWKFETDELTDLPKNVKIGKWLPQSDLLAHPNLKLFITHGGLLSTTEIVYHGVPALAIPLMGDQKLNAQNIEKIGIGLSLEFGDLTEKLLLDTINEMLDNPKYRENAKLKSKLFHDRQNKPMDTAAYWVDYVARHKGAPHLRVAGVDLPFYKYHNLDAFAVIAIAGLVGIVVHIWIMKKMWAFAKKILCKRCCAKNKKSKDVAKKNQ